MKQTFTTGKIKQEFEVPESPITAEMVFKEVYEEGHYARGLEYLQGIKNPTVIDAGAYIGISARYLAQKKDALIYALEPNPISYDALVINSKDNKRIIPVNCAIGGLEGVRNMKESDPSKVVMSFYGKGKDSFPAQCLTIESFCNFYDIKTVDLLKVDIEGGEYELMLSNSFKNFAKNVKCIIGELHEHPLPHYVMPTILKQLGFDFEMLPIENFVQYYKYVLNEGMTGELYIKIPTMFIAKRI